MTEVQEGYRLYNPEDTQKLLKDKKIISRIVKYDRARTRKKDWDYTSSQSIKNPALIFGKFIPSTSQEKENKEKYLQLVVKEIRGLLLSTNLLKNLQERIEFWIKNSGDNLEKVEAKTFWRLVIGLGASHPQETSMTLHHIYGIPYIPGSAIKGVTRHWAVLKFAEEYWKLLQSNQKNDKKFEDSIKRVAEGLENSDDLVIEVDGIAFKDLIEIFGTQKQQGKVIFFDAYPVGGINLKIDIMNPHYPNYYSEGQPPTDWQNPVPIKFLTVEDTKFRFYLTSRSIDDPHKELLSRTKRLLSEALKKYGVGAKTSLGYGIFT